MLGINPNAECALRLLETARPRAGELELAIPKIRRGSYFPSFLEPRRRSEQALVSVIQQAYGESGANP